MESVARTSGLVHLGDVIVAIDGINVLSKSYQGIIDALKSKPKDDGVRRIKFRKSVVRLNFFSVCRFFCIT
jgi:C-terminal processing protease CtpA/Prc